MNVGTKRGREFGTLEAASVDARLIKGAIVDDDRDVRQTIAELLRNGCAMSLFGVYACSHQALRRIPHKMPDVVVIDQKMPKMSGVELGERIKLLAPRIRLVLLTGYPSEKLVLQGLVGGFDGFLEKPVTSRELLHAIQSVAEGYPYLSRGMTKLLVGCFHRIENAGQKISLTNREREVLVGIVRGLHDKEIAAELEMSPATVHTHVTHLFHKFQVHSRQALLKKLILGE